MPPSASGSETPIFFLFIVLPSPVLPKHIFLLALKAPWQGKAVPRLLTHGPAEVHGGATTCPQSTRRSSAELGKVDGFCKYRASLRLDMRNPALTEAPRNLPSLSKRGGFSPRDTEQQESYMKQTRPEAGIFKGDLRTQTFNPHENKWESVGRKGLSYIHANQMVKISYNW